MIIFYNTQSFDYKHITWLALKNCNIYSFFFIRYATFYIFSHLIIVE